MNEVFTRVLMRWGKTVRRDLPWVGEKDPYRIWLSEVMLQQTRVEQGLPFYNRFIRRFPTLESLAKAEEDQVFKYWEGLGYYSRARNLHRAAQQVWSDRKGVFPTTYADLLALPGVGEYTAAAIASFAYGLPHAVVDGNVQRVLARYFGMEHPLQSAIGRKAFRLKADAVLYRKDPGAWNQAIMDFGSLVCKPRLPSCHTCPLAEHCIAWRDDRVGELPAKKPAPARRSRYFHYIVAESGEQTWVRRREGRDIWAKLYEFPLLERDGRTDPSTLLQTEDARALLGGQPWVVEEVSPWYRQILSHQTVEACFVKISPARGKLPGNEQFRAVRQDELGDLALPRIITRYLQRDAR